LNLSEEEKDDKLKQYIMPAAGLGSFDVSRDGTKVTFAFKGDLYLVTRRQNSAAAAHQDKGSGIAADFLSRRNENRLYSRRTGRRSGTLYGQIWQATDIEAGGALAAYHWSPDGKSFVYAVGAANPGSCRSPTTPAVWLPAGISPKRRR